MCLRYTRVRGLEKNRCNASMIFACHNLKKMAIWKARKDKNKTKIVSILQKTLNLFKNFEQKRQISKNYTYLSTV